jgi:hypothetical protein
MVRQNLTDTGRLVILVRAPGGAALGASPAGLRTAVERRRAEWAE